MATFLVVTAVLAVAAALGTALALDLAAEYLDGQPARRVIDTTASAKSDAQNSQSTQS